MLGGSIMANNEKIVVFGGAGFLGSHLADALSDEGYHVTIFDVRQSTWLRKDQQMIVADITDARAVEAAIKNAIYVYHLAGIADIGTAAAQPKATIKNNVVGTTNIVDACTKAGVKRLLFASTIYVYSDRGSFYRVSKQASELVIETYAQQFGLEYTILRYGSLYGPRAQEWNGLMRFVTQAVREHKIVYPGTGNERREYIHVRDAAQLSVKALHADYSDQCLTVTGAQVLSTKEMIDMICEISGLDIEVVFDITEDESQVKQHYALTPYRYTPKQGRKIIPSSFIDIGQGILDLIEGVSQSKDDT